MSWSLSVSPRKAPEIFGAIDAAEPTHSLSDESTEQVRAAKDAAKALIQTGAVGGEDKAYSVSLSGHANPGHSPSASGAMDSLNISISQREEATG